MRAKPALGLLPLCFLLLPGEAAGAPGRTPHGGRRKPGPSSSETQTSPAAQQARSFRATYTKEVSASYLLHLPRDYEADRSRRWPLLLFLHGSGERGADLDKVKKHGPPSVLDSRPEFPFIVVSPQCPEGEWWDTPTLIKLLDAVEARYRVDRSRVYVTGNSMGGYATWDLACAQPERFAAIAPICGEGQTDIACKLKNVPVWAFHGEKDPYVDPRGSTEMVAEINRCGGDAKVTLYPNTGHNAWTRTYENPELYDWLLKHTRPRPHERKEQPGTGRSKTE